jgi:tRNA uridine 5-carboxymethylaminomethyl modification enzyme
MFTSRAEHRLNLRCDNSENRLRDHAWEVGLLPAAELARLDARERARERILARLHAWRTDDPAGGGGCSAADLLRRTGVSVDDLGTLARRGPELQAQLASDLRAELGPGEEHLGDGVVAEVVNEIKYAGYIRRQERTLAELAHLDAMEIPADLPYADAAALSGEAREKLARMRPGTLGQASRIDGVRAGDLAVLTVLVRRHRAQRAGAGA